jgi:radical SAM superfamily enzyme YgiQ (UPF0313 family)
MTPEFIRAWLAENQYRMDGPEQYYGDEPGTERRSWENSQLRWLITASWDYSQASGNMAIPAVYRSIHDASSTYLCDRFYLPKTPRDLRLLERAGIPAHGIESKHPLSGFDVVGTSISYTVLFQNFCKLLSMSGVPLRREHRRKWGAANYPMVIVGGQAYCAPEFMAPVVDCVWLGEVEDEPGNGGIGQVCEAIAAFKADGSWQDDRAGCYRQLALWFSYLYFPEFTQVHYRYEDRGLKYLSKQVSGYRSLLPGMRYPHRARKVHELDKVTLLDEWPLLYSDPGMGAGDEEVQRGCTEWCSFCRLSWVTKPYRQESVSRSVERAARIRLNQGSLEMSPFGPDFPVHTQKKELLAGLLENVSDEVSSSSMRIDDFNGDPDYSVLMSMGGTDSITLGLEGNSQRMRDLVGKGSSDADVIEVVTRAIRVGIRKIKLYMISNLPGEERDDVMRIVELGQKLAEVRNSFGEAARGVRIQFSWTPLLLEAQTPLQWFEVTAPDYTLKEALDELRKHHIDMKIGTKAAPEKLAFFQACQRASYDAGEAIVDVIDRIGTASWGGFPKNMPERLDAALKCHGFLNGLADLFGERYEHDLFGWEHISTGVDKGLMWKTYRQMVEFLEGTNAATYDAGYDETYLGNKWVPGCDDTCQGASCGACDHQDLRLRTAYLKKDERDISDRPVRPLDQTSVAVRLRVRVTKDPAHRFISGDALPWIVRRAAYRAAEETGFPAIAKRTVRFASDPLKYRERSAGVDYLDFGVTRLIGGASSLQVHGFMGALGVELEPWLSVGGHDVVPADAQMPRRPVSLWQLEVDDTPGVIAGALSDWRLSGSVPVKLRSDSFYAGEQEEDADAKDHVADFWLTRDRHVYRLNMLLTGQLGPYQAYAALLGKPSWLEAARHPAVRIDFFTPQSFREAEFGQVCVSCGGAIPVNLLRWPFHEHYCPRCKDEAARLVVASLVTVLKTAAWPKSGRARPH